MTKASANLSTAFLADIRQELITEQAHIEKELSAFAHRDPENPSNFNVMLEDTGTEEGENAAEVAQFADNLSLEQELEKGLKDVQSAIKALDDGSYGTCKYCKQPISEERLRIRPTSTSCVACKKSLTQEA